MQHVVFAVVQLFAFASVSSLGAVTRTPKSNLLLSTRSAVVVGTGSQQQPDTFFTKDAEKMDELPNAVKLDQQKKQCHPMCKWSCGTSKCNTKCEPRCKAPKCATACKKPTMAKCKRTCKDPQCAVVCPQSVAQCESGNCPMCKTVCGASLCSMDCGQENRCESQCADPECTWDCKADLACAKPECKMKCDSSNCSFGAEQKLPTESEVPYMGQEIAWKGLGKIPAEDLAHFAPKSFTKVEMPTGAKMFGGAKPA